ncbi:MAG: SDR family NAD(P)-dependent oxidoreductase [Beijerinckiaceae bacterium]|nr:SDR family NAD(P)-dependent oxidoreductase [Beijerinckiaceae bacterium]
MTSRIIAGKRVLVTGAFGGIGAALVKALLQSDASHVYAASRTPGAGHDPRVTPVALDITASDDAERLARDVDIDILVNNAGVNTNRSILAESHSDGAWREMDVNYFGLLNMCRAFAPQMKDRGAGVIVNILSSASLSPVPRMGTYCASKAAAWSLTQCLRVELEPAGVDVIAIFPGATDTALTAHLTSPKLTPEQVAEGTIMAIRNGLFEHKMKMGVTHGVALEQAARK